MANAIALIRRCPCGMTWLSFGRLAEAARRASEDVERIVLFYQAAALYTGDYLPKVGAEWAGRVRSELLNQYFEILNSLIELLKRQRRFEEVITLSRRGLEMDFFREDLHRAIMSSLAATGRATGALRHYESVTSHLAKELNATPSVETTALAERIRAGKPLDSLDTISV